MINLYEFMDLTIASIGLILVAILGVVNIWILIKLNNQSIETTKVVNDANEKFTIELNNQNIENQKYLSEQNLENQRILFNQNRNIMLYEQRKNTINMIHTIYKNNSFYTGVEKGINNTRNINNMNDLIVTFFIETEILHQKDGEIYYKIKSDIEILYENKYYRNIIRLLELNNDRHLYFTSNREKLEIGIKNINTKIEGYKPEELNFYIYNSSHEMKEYYAKYQYLMQETNNLEVELKKFLFDSISLK